MMRVDIGNEIFTSGRARESIVIEFMTEQPLVDAVRL
jgi:hypothetical protein